MLWYAESTCDKKLQYFGVSLYIKIVTSLWRHNNKFTRYTKTFLNTYKSKCLKIHSIPNSHRNHKEKFCELDYFEKNEKDQNLPFSDLIFIFLAEFHFLWDVSFAFQSCYIQFLTHFHLLLLENCGGN